MEVVIAVIVGLALGGAAVFFVKKYKDEIQKKSARIEADKILSKAKNEANKIKKDSEAKSKDFEVRSRKNLEAEIQKTKKSNAFKRTTARKKN